MLVISCTYEHNINHFLLTKTFFLIMFLTKDFAILMIEMVVT